MVCVLRANSKPQGDCWIWTGSTTHHSGKDYGQLTYQKTKYDLSIFVGLITGHERSESHLPAQSCGKLLCCNPDHASVRPRMRPARKLK